MTSGHQRDHRAANGADHQGACQHDFDRSRVAYVARAGNDRAAEPFRRQTRAFCDPFPQEQCRHQPQISSAFSANAATGTANARTAARATF